MGNITVLLSEIRGGNEQASSELYSQVYGELTRIARHRLGGAQQASLDAPSLVHEAYLRLAEQEMPTLRDRRDFFAYAAAVMRNVTIDTVRRMNAQKRGSGATQLTLSSADTGLGPEGLEAELLHEALELLEKVDPRAHRIVEMRYFAGLTNDEIAEVLQVSPITVKRSWRAARTFLYKELRK